MPSLPSAVDCLNCALLPRRYLSKFKVPVCYPEFSKSNILSTGRVATTASCKSPYDSLGGSAAYWCAAPLAPTCCAGCAVAFANCECSL